MSQSADLVEVAASETCTAKKVTRIDTVKTRRKRKLGTAGRVFTTFFGMVSAASLASGAVIRARGGVYSTPDMPGEDPIYYSGNGLLVLSAVAAVPAIVVPFTLVSTDRTSSKSTRRESVEVACPSNMSFQVKLGEVPIGKIDGPGETLTIDLAAIPPAEILNLRARPPMYVDGRFVGSVDAKNVRARAEQATWAVASECSGTSRETPACLAAAEIVERWPSHGHAADAERLLQQVDQNQIDEAVRARWEVARECSGASRDTPSCEAAAEIMKRWPSHVLAAEARRLLQQVDENRKVEAAAKARLERLEFLRTPILGDFRFGDPVAKLQRICRVAGWRREGPVCTSPQNDERSGFHPYGLMANAILYDSTDSARVLSVHGGLSIATYTENVQAAESVVRRLSESPPRMIGVCLYGYESMGPVHVLFVPSRTPLTTIFTVCEGEACDDRMRNVILEYCGVR